MTSMLEALESGAVVEFRWLPRGSEPPAGWTADSEQRCHHDHWSFGAWRVVEDAEAAQ